MHTRSYRLIGWAKKKLLVLRLNVVFNEKTILREQFNYLRGLAVYPMTVEDFVSS